MATYQTVVEPNLGENTYLVINSQKEALLVDPGAPLAKIQAAVQAAGANVVGIILTHGHFDHIATVDACATHYAVPAFIHTKDANCFTQKRANLGTITLETQPIRLKGSEGTQAIGQFTVNFWHVPGHSPGSTIFTLDQDQVILSGDVLFNGSVGRYDFPTSNATHHQNSLNRIFAIFSDEYRVLPGHGTPTTIGQERQHNPFKAWF